MRYTRYCRTLLSTPASAPDWYAKGHCAGADICVLDLEDSVPADDKEKARIQAEAFFCLPTAAQTRCGLRINGVTEPDGLRDLLAVQRYHVKPAVVVVPKVESARDIEIVARLLGPACPTTDLFAVVETPRGVDNLTAIAKVSSPLRALIFGAADYSFAVGARRSWEDLVHARARVVNSARAADLEAIDSPMFELSDLDALRVEAHRAQDLGFSGKLAVHPRQIPVINEVFSPDMPTLETARRIVAAGRSSASNIAVVDGVMVGPPFYEASRQLIEEFGAPGELALSGPDGRDSGWT